MNGRTNVTDSKTNDLQIPLDSCTNLVVTAGNGQVSLSWTDPLDKYATPEGEIAQNPQQLVSIWAYTKVVRKENSEPASPNDGITILESAIRNQYESTAFVDNTVTNEVTYYYSLFAYNEDGVHSDPISSDPITPKYGTPLSELAEGTLIKINEDGAPIEFYLAKHNYESAINGEGRDLLVRKDSPRNMPFSSYSYELTSIYRWFMRTYINRFSQNVINLIGSTKFPYIKKINISFGNYNDEATELDSPIAALSSMELGCTLFAGSGSSKYEGRALPIANVLRHYDRQYSRSIMTTDNNHVIAILNNGGYTLADGATEYPVLPAFTIPTNTEVDPDLNLIEI